MDDMVTRVARAMFEAQEKSKSGFVEPRTWDDVGPYERGITWEPIARASLLALREPTEGMVDAMNPVGSQDDPPKYVGYLSRREVVSIWHAAIDHALQTQGEGE